MEKCKNNLEISIQRLFSEVEGKGKPSTEKIASLPNTAEGHREDRILILGTQLLQKMNWNRHEALRTTARILVDKRLGHFRSTINPHTYIAMVDYKMKQIAVARYDRTDKQTVG
jgi:hypothetical protein